MVTIRPIRPDDARGLQAGFKRLSAQSIYLRFLGMVTELSDDQARSLATVDYRSRMAFVACLPVGGNEILVGVARYSMVNKDDPGLAECAVIVGDEYQGRGLGLCLLDLLVRYARAHGVKKFLATFHSTNSRVKDLIQHSGLAFEKKMIEPGVWEIRLHLETEE